MNVFFLDPSQERAAKYHCDKHVVKMILESAQMLSTVLDQRGYKKFAPYKPTHRNHPCTVWANKKPQNYNWLRTLAICLCDEYTFRYDKKHKSHDLILSTPEIIKFTNFSITEPAQAMSPFYKGNNVVEAYRLYYLIEKTIFASYKRRLPPLWYREKIDWYYDAKKDKWFPDMEQYASLLSKILNSQV